MRNDLLLSVIVPVYNTAPYLRKCLDSVVHQTYRNLEIILVADGGSADDSTEICEEYAATDERIKILYRPHEGVMCARKAAVMAASGDYIACLDSDDWLDLNAYEKLLSAIGELSPDILMHGYQSEYPEKTVICQYNVPLGYFDANGIRDEIHPRLLKAGRTYQWEFPAGYDVDDFSLKGQMRPNLQSDILECLWSKIVKRELLQKSHMMVPDEVSIGEDLVCSMYTLFSVCSAMVVDLAPYHYRVRQVSGSHGDIAVDQYKKMFSALYTAVSGRPMTEIYLTRLYGLMLRSLLTSGYELFLDGEFSDILFGNLDGCRVALYGAGKCGQEIYNRTMEIFPERIVLWVDRQHEKCRRENLPVEPVEELLRRDFDVVIIALIDEDICGEIKQDLINMGIMPEKIRYVSATPEVLNAAKKVMLD